MESQLVTGLEPLTAPWRRRTGAAADRGVHLPDRGRERGRRGVPCQKAERWPGWSDWSEPCTKQTEPPVPKTLNQPTLRRAKHHSAEPWPSNPWVGRPLGKCGVAA